MKNQAVFGVPSENSWYIGRHNNVPSAVEPAAGRGRPKIYPSLAGPANVKFRVAGRSERLPWQMPVLTGYRDAETIRGFRRFDRTTVEMLELLISFVHGEADCPSFHYLNP